MVEAARDFIRKIGIAFAIPGEGLFPRAVQCRAALADAVRETIIDAIRHQELHVFRPAIEFLGLANLILAKWITVDGGGVLFVGRAIADDAVDDDQGGRPLVSLNSSSASRTRCISLASGTCTICQPYPRKRSETFSLKASSV